MLIPRAIALEVPDAKNYLGGSGAPWQDLYMEHLGHFSRKSLIALLQRNGLVPLALERADFHLPGGRTQKVLWAVAAYTDTHTDSCIHTEGAARR